MKKILFIVGLFLSPFLAQAATFHFDHPYEVRSEETVITVLLDTSGDKVNAVGGSFTLPKGLTLSKISTGGSILVLWVEQPKETNGTVSFSGIIPGGFIGDGKLFSFTLKNSEITQATLTFTDGEVHRNDSEGTLIGSRLLATHFAFSNTTGGTDAFADTTAPEKFVLTIEKDESINEGRFVVFATQDKGTGIQKYEWATSWFGEPSKGAWKETSGQVFLSKLDLFKTIYVRATDNAGNTRVEKVAGSYIYATRVFEVIIIGIALWVLFLFARRYLR